ncbi:MAG TPA: MFS transporter [Candidatus Saccharimonadales bacterium]|nr:MFS transporter [Candidatus Saccharimonadales bacterium]
MRLDERTHRNRPFLGSATHVVNRPGVALMSIAHGVDDLYQGCVAALLPFLVIQRHYSYAAVSGLALAATILSSVAQPAFGWLTDQRPRRWMIPAGMTVAGLGIGAVGLASSYPITWLLMAVSGLGIAAFHPEAARAARRASGNSTRAMSVFALGGNVGYALGPVLVTPVLLIVGLRGTPIFVLPVLVMAALLIARLNRTLDGRPGELRTFALPLGVDDWPAFARLTSVVVVRSMLFFGLSTFLGLHFIRDLGASPVEAGAALTTFLVSGAAGTLLGGWLADRVGKVTCIRVGFALAIPALVGLALATTQLLAIALVAVTGVAVFLPFSVFVVLGQDYLPNRIGTASGVTVGLAVSVGGVAAPALGLLADRTSLRTVFAGLVLLPMLALALSALLRNPDNLS